VAEREILQSFRLEEQEITIKGKTAISKDTGCKKGEDTDE